MQWTRGVVSLNFLKTSLTAFLSSLTDAEESCGFLRKQKRFRHIDFLRQHYLDQVIRDCLSLVFVRHPRHAFNVKQQAAGKVKLHATKREIIFLLFPLSL